MWDRCPPSVRTSTSREQCCHPADLPPCSFAALDLKKKHFPIIRAGSEKEETGKNTLSGKKKKKRFLKNKSTCFCLCHRLCVGTGSIQGPRRFSALALGSSSAWLVVSFLQPRAGSTSLIQGYFSGAFPGSSILVPPCCGGQAPRSCTPRSGRRGCSGTSR